MSSLEIAARAGRRHDNVLRDIRKMSEELGLSLTFEEKSSGNGRPLTVVNLPKRETLILVTGYSVPIRAAIIDRWQELETMMSQATTVNTGLVTDLAAEVRSAIFSFASPAKLQSELGEPFGTVVIQVESLVARDGGEVSRGLCGRGSAPLQPVDHAQMLDSQSPAPALHFLHRMWSIAMPRTPKDLADRMAARRLAKADDGFARETFTQPRDQARQTARAFLDRLAAAAYISAVETWRELPDGKIEFTMRRLRSAD